MTKTTDKFLIAFYIRIVERYKYSNNFLFWMALYTQQNTSQMSPKQILSHKKPQFKDTHELGTSTFYLHESSLPESTFLPLEFFLPRTFKETKTRCWLILMRLQTLCEVTDIEDKRRKSRTRAQYRFTISIRECEYSANKYAIILNHSLLRRWRWNRVLKWAPTTLFENVFMT